MPASNAWAIAEVITVLDQATRVINEIQASQRALEIKVDENTAALKYDMKRLETTVQNNAKLFIDMNAATNERICRGNVLYLP
jgi:cyanophycinase-like exopeptidase